MGHESNYIFNPPTYPTTGTFAIITFVLCACDYFKEMPHVKSGVFNHFFHNPKPKNGAKTHNRDKLGPRNKRPPRPIYGDQLGNPSYEQRLYVNNLINKYIELKSEVRNKVENFNLPVKTMGLHIRSKARYTQHIKQNYSISEPPMKEFIELINNSDYENVLICSDNKDIKNEIRTECPNKNIISYTERLEGGGETHRANKNDYTIVEDAIVEAYLLSKCKYFVHSISNMSNFVQFLSPELENYNIIEKYRK